MPSINNPFKGTQCLSLCIPDPQKVIGMIKNVQRLRPNKTKSFKASTFHYFFEKF